MSTTEPCPVCIAYRARRGNTLRIAVTAAANHAQVDPAYLMALYQLSVHERHIGGGCLSTRPRTPHEKRGTTTTLHVKRSCNGCGTDLGDATAAELDAAVVGEQLPDVRLECGCCAAVSA